MAHSHEKICGCSRSSCSFTRLLVDHPTAQIEVVRISGGIGVKILEVVDWSQLESAAATRISRS